MQRRQQQVKACTICPSSILCNLARSNVVLCKLPMLQHAVSDRISGIWCIVTEPAIQCLDVRLVLANASSQIRLRTCIARSCTGGQVGHQASRLIRQFECRRHRPRHVHHMRHG
jgi:hypothetical protein